MRRDFMRKRSKGKGRLEEVISYARFADEIAKYRVLYRDFDQVVESSLQKFLEQDDPAIPWHRIHVIHVKEGDTIHAVYVKHGHCPNCGQKLPDEKQSCVCRCGYVMDL